MPAAPPTRSHALTTLLACEIHVLYRRLASETSRLHVLIGAFDARSHEAQTLARAPHAPGVLQPHALTST
jgi:hypothetical protein